MRERSCRARRCRNLLLMSAVSMALAGVSVPAHGSEIQVSSNDSYSHFGPSWSPDGTKLVCCMRVNLTFSLWIIDVATATDTLLIGDDHYRISPVWSPDGSKIAYAVLDDVGTYQIAICPSTGGSETVVTSGLTSCSNPKWSPDGNLILYERREAFGYTQIYTHPPFVAPDEIALTSDATSHGYPMWSPDGQSVVCGEIDANGFCQIVVVDATHKTETKLTSDACDHQYPCWSPDGNTIVYAKMDSTGYWQIYTVPSAGGAELPMTSDSIDHSLPSYSPNGGWILYLTHDPIDTIDQICRISSGGGSPFSLTSAEARRDAPRWSPDGGLIAYQRQNSSGKWQCYTVNNWQTVGWASVNGISPISGLILYGSRSGMGMSGLAAQPATSQPSAGSHTYVLTHFHQSDRWYTGVVVVNLTSSVIKATLTAYSVAGNEIVSVAENIPAGGKISKMVDTFMGITKNTGWIKVETTGDAAVFDLYGDKIDGGQAAIPNSEVNHCLEVPYFSCNKTWWTGIAVANPNPIPVTVEFRASGLGGETFALWSAQIPAHGKLSGLLDTLVPSLSGKTGWIHIYATDEGGSSSENIAVIAMYGDKSSTPSEIAAVSATSTSKTLFFSDFHMVPSDRGLVGWKSWTSLSIVHTNPWTHNTVTLKAYKPGGGLIQTRKITLGPVCMMSSLVSSIFPALGTTRDGWVSVTATEPVAGMQFIKLDDQATNTWGLAAIESQRSSPELYMPHYSCGTAWWTRFGIANASSPSAAAIVSLNAYGNDGVLAGNSSFWLGYTARDFSDVRDIFDVE